MSLVAPGVVTWFHQVIGTGAFGIVRLCRHKAVVDDGLAEAQIGIQICRDDLDLSRWLMMVDDGCCWNSSLSWLMMVDDG